MDRAHRGHKSTDLLIFCLQLLSHLLVLCAHLLVLCPQLLSHLLVLNFKQLEHLLFPLPQPSVPLDNLRLEHLHEPRTGHQPCAGYQLDADQVLVTPYGFAPMPRPPRANRDGSGRLWPGTDPTVAIHPVFWLPPSVTVQRDNEDDDTFAIRLHLELVDRQMLDPDNQSVRNPFVDHDLDTTHDAFITDLVDYMAGQRVDWLAKFAIADGPTTADAIAEQAQALTTNYRDRYHRLKGRFADRANVVFHSQKQLLDGASASDDTAAILRAAQAHEQKGSSDTGQLLTDAVEEFIVRLDGYGRAGAVMVSAERAAMTGKPADLASQLADLAVQEDERATYLRQRSARALRDPDEGNLAGLWQAITQGWEHVVGEGREAAQRAIRARGEN